MSASACALSWAVDANLPGSLGNAGSAIVNQGPRNPAARKHLQRRAGVLFSSFIRRAKNSYKGFHVFEDSVIRAIPGSRMEAMGQQYDSGKVLWFVAGAAVGASVALLYAPQSGRVTRRIITRKTRQGARRRWPKPAVLGRKGPRAYMSRAGAWPTRRAELFERGRKLMEG